jgi:hypothetical protein
MYPENIHTPSEGIVISQMLLSELDMLEDEMVSELTVYPNMEEASVGGLL